MSVLWLLFIGGLVVLPGSALLALRWAARQGEFRNFQKIALSIFDEEEPVGEMTDHFPPGGVHAPTDSHAGPAGALFPLTPALSPGERENLRPLSVEPSAHEYNPTRPKTLPLPKGEGRGALPLN